MPDAGAQVALMRKTMGKKTVTKTILGFLDSALPKGDDIPEDQKIARVVSKRVGEYATEQKMTFNQYLDAITGGKLDDDITLERVEGMTGKEIYDMMMSHFGEANPVMSK